MTSHSSTHSLDSGPYILGLTGSIGMGKSAVSAMFLRLGIPVFCADTAVHRLQGPGGKLVPAIEAAFPGVTGKDGVDRQKLSAAVLGNRQALSLLEGIVHPAVAAERKAFLKANCDAPLVVFDIPLLYEKGGHAGVHAVVVVSAPADMQRARVLARPGMTVQKFEQILALQVPDTQKREKADFIIDTGTPLAETEAAVLTLVRQLVPDYKRPET